VIRAPGFDSPDNARYRRWKRWVAEPKAARAAGMVFLEGAHLVEACLDACGDGALAPPAVVLLRASAASRPSLTELSRRLDEALALPDVLFDRLSPVAGDNGILAFVPRERPVRAPALAQPPRGTGPRFEIWLDGVQDPGNVGTCIRSAAAFGAARVVLGRGSADPWSARCLRSGMGGQFRVPVHEVDDLGIAATRHPGPVIGLDASGDATIESLTGQAAADDQAIAWVFGAEGSGLSPALAGAVSRLARITMPGHAESLNVAAAVAIVCYAQQRTLAASEQRP
jgi:TrmH family RNA methyltransferase